MIFSSISSDSKYTKFLEIFQNHPYLITIFKSLYQSENFFSSESIIDAREEKDDNTDSNIELIIVDFPLILIVCTNGFIIALLGEKIIKSFYYKNVSH